MQFAATIISIGLVAWFILLAGGEFVSARARTPLESKSDDARLLTNFGLGAIVLLLNGALPSARVGAAVLTPTFGGGLQSLLLLPWAGTLLLLITVDTFTTYWTHRLMHTIPLLWRVHRVHHSDSEVDVSTSLRNHPLELLVSAPIAATVIIVTGAPVAVVLTAQAIAVAANIWQHADVSVPRLERAISTVMVTPSIHRIHHNPERRFHDNNYGEFLVIWDRLFRTFISGPDRGPVGLSGEIGQENGLLKQIWSPLQSA